MKKQEIIDLASRRGLCVYEQYKAYIKHGDIVLSGDERIFDYDFE